MRNVTSWYGDALFILNLSSTSSRVVCRLRPSWNSYLHVFRITQSSVCCWYIYIYIQYHMSQALPGRKTALLADPSAWFASAKSGSPEASRWGPSESRSSTNMTWATRDANCTSDSPFRRQRYDWLKAITSMMIIVITYLYVLYIYIYMEFHMFFIDSWLYINLLSFILTMYVIVIGFVSSCFF